jgi:hypothetical protein
MNERGAAREKIEEQNTLYSFAHLITWLDGYVALSCVDPVRIERMVRNYPQEDLVRAWAQAKDDVYKIGKLPTSSSKIIRLTKISNITKIMFILVGVIAVILWLLVSRLGFPFFSGPYSELALLAALVVAYNLNLFAYYWSGRRLNAEVREFYEKHSGEVSGQRKHLRQITQGLIDGLTMRVLRHEHDPKKYGFTLFHTNYKNIRIVEQRGNRYTAIVRARMIENN